MLFVGAGEESLWVVTVLQDGLGAPGCVWAEAAMIGPGLSFEVFLVHGQCRIGVGGHQ